MDCFRGRMSAVIAANHSVDSLLLFCCSCYLLRFAASLFFYDLTHVLDGDVPSKSSFHGRSASGWLLFPEVNDVSVRYCQKGLCQFKKHPPSSDDSSTHFSLRSLKEYRYHR